MFHEYKNMSVAICLGFNQAACGEVPEPLHELPQSSEPAFQT